MCGMNLYAIKASFNSKLSSCSKSIDLLIYFGSVIARGMRRIFMAGKSRPTADGAIGFLKVARQQHDPDG